MWHVAVECHTAADILPTVLLFSYYCEVVQNVSQPTHTQYVWYGGVVLPALQNTVNQISNTRWTLYLYTE